MSLSGDVCVVTGACGFLGRRLVGLLLEEEKMAEVRLLDKNVQPHFVQTLEGKEVCLVYGFQQQKWENTEVCVCFHHG